MTAGLGIRIGGEPAGSLPATADQASHRIYCSPCSFRSGVKSTLPSVTFRTPSDSSPLRLRWAEYLSGAPQINSIAVSKTAFHVDAVFTCRGRTIAPEQFSTAQLRLVSISPRRSAITILLSLAPEVSRIVPAAG